MRAGTSARSGRSPAATSSFRTARPGRETRRERLPRRREWWGCHAVAVDKQDQSIQTRCPAEEPDEQALPCDAVRCCPRFSGLARISQFTTVEQFASGVQHGATAHEGAGVNRPLRVVVLLIRNRSKQTVRWSDGTRAKGASRHNRTFPPAI